MHDDNGFFMNKRAHLKLDGVLYTAFVSEYFRSDRMIVVGVPMFAIYYITPEIINSQKTGPHIHTRSPTVLVENYLP